MLECCLQAQETDGKFVWFSMVGSSCEHHRTDCWVRGSLSSQQSFWMLLQLWDLPPARICKCAHFWSNTSAMESRVRMNWLSVLIFSNRMSADCPAAHPVAFPRVNYRFTGVGRCFWKSSGPQSTPLTPTGLFSWLVIFNAKKWFLRFK